MAFEEYLFIFGALGDLAPFVIGLFIFIPLIWWYTSKAKGKYTVNAIIFETRQGNKLWPVLAKAGRFLKKDGNYKYFFKFPKFPFGTVKETKPFDFDKLVTGAGQFLFAIRTSVDQIVPCEISVVKEIIKGFVTDKETGKKKEVEKSVSGLMKIKVFDEDLRPMMIEENRRACTRYLSQKSLMDKMGPLILIIVFAIAVAIIMYGGAKFVGSWPSCPAQVLT